VRDLIKTIDRQVAKALPKEVVMSSPGEPRDVGLITPETIERLIKIKPSTKEFFVRSWNKVLFAIEKLDEFSQQAASVSGWLPTEGATAKELADEMTKKCGERRYYVINFKENRLLWIGCFFDLLMQNALAPHLTLASVKWIDAACFIHEQDSTIRDQDGVAPIFFQGDVVTVATGFGQVIISWHASNSFWKRLGISQLARNNLPEYNPGLKRDSLLLLINLLRSSQPVERENRVTQLLKHGFRPADYRVARGWIFVIAAGSLITCYEKGDIAQAGYIYKGQETSSGKAGLERIKRENKRRRKKRQWDGGSKKNSNEKEI